MSDDPMQTETSSVEHLSSALLHGDSGVHLLVVDDDMLLRSMAVKALKHAGFTVSDASNGEDALAKFGNHTYDLVLLDVMMPGMDGYEVCLRLRDLPQGARVPILMLTGLNDTDSIELAYRNGATDFITKPINWTLLSHRVRYALRASAAAEAMRRNVEVLSRAQRLAKMGTWQVDLTGRATFSQEHIDLFKIPPEVVEAGDAAAMKSRVIPDDKQRVSAARVLLTTQGKPFEMEFQVKRFDGVVRTVYEQAVCVLDGQGKLVRFEGITQDITERAEAQAQIRQLENMDAITGLPNRQFFAELCAAPLQWAQLNGSRCTLVHIDIDRFKSVNDAFGRAQGDRVLQILASRLRAWDEGVPSSFANTDTAKGVLARVGGNAFALLLCHVANQEQASAVALRLLTILSQPLSIVQQSLVLSASIGIAMFPSDAQTLSALAGCAEQAAYAAKGVGRAQHRFFDEQMNAKASLRLVMESELRRAIVDGELRLHYQPKVDADTGKIVGAEALVRWQHGMRGLVSPNEFIPLAEETGLILPLTDWVTETVCSDIRRWIDDGLVIVPISVNLAAPSLADLTLVDKLDALMRRFNLTASSLILEVTETMVMGDVAQSIVLLERLRARGYCLSLDDFGTGYSSLSYLKQLPLDELKVDRSFIIECAAGGRDGALASAIIALGLELGLHMVAEGIETEAQSAFLLGRGCCVQQGYLFSRPVAVSVFADLLKVGAIHQLPQSVENSGKI